VLIFFSCASIFADMLNDESRRKIAGWTIMFTCVGVLLLTYAASNLGLPRWV
jgi:cationic amino acid transporter 1